ncbi:ribonuclease H-like domain-containing protein [Treponema sp. TIM-1]|uniref:ribonuclease H-like domain-containing protein n=1 Tax=Treponema sp. TIM-1 TaxID=2898417 RepID=UPI003980A3F7
MAGNLRDRLRRIRNAPAPPPGGVLPSPRAETPSLGPEWQEAGYQTLKRTELLDLPLSLDFPLPRSLPILVPDLLRYPSEEVGPEDMVFFDLETTGLSRGAGTVAFLAAFGRLVSSGPGPLRLRLDQYLLLDYPGEGDFLAALLPQFDPRPRPPLVITYNGKTFDSQILASRCIVMGIRPPAYYQGDLLHPARRLWKGILSSCSQGEIETAILGLDRTGDVSGALAPDIWFSFLKSSDPRPLLGICDHNRRDILGLAGLFSALVRIAGDPLAARNKFRYDTEALALRWREFPVKIRNRSFGEAAVETGRKLLAVAAEEHPRAALVFAQDLLRQGRAAEGRRRLLGIARGNYADPFRAAAYRALAVDAEWRRKVPGEALTLVEEALALADAGEGQRRDFLRREERLRRQLDRKTRG